MARMIGRIFPSEEKTIIEEEKPIVKEENIKKPRTTKLKDEKHPKKK